MHRRIKYWWNVWKGDKFLVMLQHWNIGNNSAWRKSVYISSQFFQDFHFVLHVCFSHFPRPHLRGEVGKGRTELFPTGCFCVWLLYLYVLFTTVYHKLAMVKKVLIFSDKINSYINNINVYVCSWKVNPCSTHELYVPSDVD